MDGSPPGSPFPGILQARTLEWVAISFSKAWKWKVKVKSHSCVRLFTTPWIAAHQAPLSMGFSRQEYWTGVPLPSPFNLARLPLLFGPLANKSSLLLGHLGLCFLAIWSFWFGDSPVPSMWYKMLNENPRTCLCVPIWILRSLASMPSFIHFSESSYCYRARTCALTVQKTKLWQWVFAVK